MNLRFNNLNILTIAVITSLAACSTQKKIRKISVAELSAKNMKPNTLVENNYLNKFVGNWLYEQGGTRFEITFTKVNSSLDMTSGPLIVQMLHGDFNYYIDGKKVILDARYTFNGFTKFESDPVSFRFNKEGEFGDTHVDLIYIEPNTLKLQLSKHAGEYGAPEKNFPLPMDITLKKVN